jgi:hypothetical protein
MDLVESGCADGHLTDHQQRPAVAEHFETGPRWGGSRCSGSRLRTFLHRLTLGLVRNLYLQLLELARVVRSARAVLSLSTARGGRASGYEAVTGRARVAEQMLPCADPLPGRSVQGGLT